MIPPAHPPLREAGVTPLVHRPLGGTGTTCPVHLGPAIVRHIGNGSNNTNDRGKLSTLRTIHLPRERLGISCLSHAGDMLPVIDRQVATLA